MINNLTIRLQMRQKVKNSLIIFNYLIIKNKSITDRYVLTIVYAIISLAK